jgi:hypothetical protein
LGKALKKVSCLVIISLFCLTSILPVVNSIYIEKSINDFQTSLDNGLMDSAWPMFHHDNKHTGRSPFGVLGNSGVVQFLPRLLIKTVQYISVAKP